MWGKMTDNYNELSMGYPQIYLAYDKYKGFTANRLLGYAESHDEERLMYKNLQFGTVLMRVIIKNFKCSLITNVSYRCGISHTVPKMIWQFGEWDGNILFFCIITAQ
jgi:hypothetical protein